MIAFLIYTLVTIVFVLIGISSWKSKEAVGFFSGVKPPKIPKDNIRAYNHSVAIIWFVFSAVFELLGIPLLFCEQNSSYFIIPVLGMICLIFGIIVAYLKVEKRFKQG